MNNLDIYKNISTTTLTPKIDIEKGIIEFDCIERLNEMIISHNKDIMNTKEELTKKALIALGWTPPKDE
jgi:hypothetical protein